MIFAVWILVGVSHVLAEISPARKVQLKQEEILSYDRFVYGRYLRTENLTCEAAGRAQRTLNIQFSKELLRAVEGPRKQLILAKELLKNTDAESCIASISDYLFNASRDVSATFRDCTTLPMASHEQLVDKFRLGSRTYITSRDNVIGNLDTCLAVYHSRQFDTLRDSCINSLHDQYFKEIKVPAVEYFKSPCIKNFNAVIECVQESATEMSRKVTNFLEKLKRCTENINQNFRLPILQTSTLLLATPLTVQVKKAQDKYSKINDEVQESLKHYYELESHASSTYDFQPKQEEFYVKSLSETLDPYFQTIRRACHDNPGYRERSCSKDALDNINQIIVRESKVYTRCDRVALGDITSRMKRVRENFTHITEQLPDLGNSAILNCISEGDIFGYNMIEKCYDIRVRHFSATKASHMADIADTVERLQNYKIAYFELPSSPLPCGTEGNDRVILEADEVLYEHSRCLYEHGGTDYTVTTPVTNVVDGTATSKLDP